MAVHHSNICQRLTSSLTKRDEGAGTVNGVVLVLMAAVLLIALAAGARILLSMARARSAADQGAIAAAQAFRAGHHDVCGIAQRQVSANAGTLVSCTVDEREGDVRVCVYMETGVPVVARVSATSRAGPVDCDS